MPGQPLRVLISGASVAGPTVAYWLCRQGFTVTVVERMPLTRVRTSGHAWTCSGTKRLFQLQAKPARALDSIHLTRSTVEE